MNRPAAPSVQAEVSTMLDPRFTLVRSHIRSAILALMGDPTTVATETSDATLAQTLLFAALELMSRYRVEDPKPSTPPKEDRSLVMPFRVGDAVMATRDLDYPNTGLRIAKGEHGVVTSRCPAESIHELPGVRVQWDARHRASPHFTSVDVLDLVMGVR